MVKIKFFAFHKIMFHELASHNRKAPLLSVSDLYSSALRKRFCLLLDEIPKMMSRKLQLRTKNFSLGRSAVANRESESEVDAKWKRKTKIPSVVGSLSSHKQRLYCRA